MITQSRYLVAFKRAVTQCREHFEIFGDGLLVEEIPNEEQKTGGGIILPAKTAITSVDGLEANRPCFVRVLAVGEGYFDEGENHVPLHCKPGEIVLVGKLNVRWLSVFGPIVPHGGAQIGFVSESSVQMKFTDDAAYKEFFTTLCADNSI